MPERIVTLLGAGFSNALGKRVGILMPSTDRLLKVALERSEGMSSLPALPGFVKALWKYRDDIDIEELYDMINIALQDQEYLWIEKTPYEPEPLRRELLHLITFYLQTIMVRATFERIMEPSQLLLGKYPSSCILTLNWDTLVDRLFNFYNEESESKIYDGTRARNFYGFQPTFQKNDYGEWSTTQQLDEKGVALLKLHGSLNWFQCVDSQHTFISKPQDAPEDYVNPGLRCPIDSSRILPLMLPPSSSKNYSLFPYLKIWRRAYEELKQADRIVIFGCSLRGADFRLRDLLSKSRIARIAGKEPKVTIIGQSTHPETEGRLRDIGFSDIETKLVNEEFPDATPSL